MDAAKVGSGVDSPRGRPIGQHRGADDHPFEAALSDQCFLPVLVFVNGAEQNRLDQAIVDETAVTSAVTGAHTSDAYEAGHATLLHRADQHTGRLGHHRNFTNQADPSRAERTQDDLVDM